MSEDALANFINNSRPLGIVFDIGANRGAYSVLFAGKSKRVFAFEPLPDAAQVIRELGRPNIKVLQCAVSYTTGKAILNVDTRENLGGVATSLMHIDGLKTKPLTVDKISIDEFCRMNFTKPDLIKIDVEGHEYFVLRGAEETIKKHRPILIFEFWETWWEIGKFDEIFSWLLPNYTLRVLQTGEDAAKLYMSKNRPCRLDGVVDIVATPKPLYARLLQSFFMVKNNKREHL